MTSINSFESNVYSEELYAGLSEADYAEVMHASAGDYEGYGEWSQELEQGQIVDSPHGQILINKECSHSGCRTTRCERDVRVGGIAI